MNWKDYHDYPGYMYKAFMAAVTFQLLCNNISQWIQEIFAFFYNVSGLWSFSYICTCIVIIIILIVFISVMESLQNPVVSMIMTIEINSSSHLAGYKAMCFNSYSLTLWHRHFKMFIPFCLIWFLFTLNI